MEFVPLILIGAVFYLLILRPSQARAKAAQRVQSELAPGVEVLTTAGLYATVAEVRDDSVILEVSPGVTNRYARAAVARVIPPPAAEDEAAPDNDAVPE